MVIFGSVSAQKVEEIDTKQFKEKIWNYDTSSRWNYCGKKHAIVDLYASWCSACQQLSPILDELQRCYGDQIQIYKVDVDKQTELTELFQVQSVPMMIFIPKDASPFVVTGVYPLEKLRQFIAERFGIQPEIKM